MQIMTVASVSRPRRGGGWKETGIEDVKVSRAFYKSTCLLSCVSLACVCLPSSCCGDVCVCVGVGVGVCMCACVTPPRTPEQVSSAAEVFRWESYRTTVGWGLVPA